MAVEEVCRHERIEIPSGMAIKEIQGEYGLSYARARRASMKGYYIENYDTPEVIIDPDNFNVAHAYSIAGRVFWKNFANEKYPYAFTLMEDMIQEGVARLYALSGKIPEMANEKYNESYQRYWVAHNAMLSFYKSFTKADRVAERCKAALEMYPVLREHLLRDGYKEEYADEDLTYQHSSD